ncbi:hypothetical protein B0H14DRAFT_2586770 [Mycena olivaceomarginata]|nr:hypothetical protein B0H14DRAFT_2586770 [Mycena olivaceomarginata]
MWLFPLAAGSFPSARLPSHLASLSTGPPPPCTSTVQRECTVHPLALGPAPVRLWRWSSSAHSAGMTLCNDHADPPSVGSQPRRTGLSRFHDCDRDQRQQPQLEHEPRHASSRMQCGGSAGVSGLITLPSAVAVTARGSDALAGVGLNLQHLLLPTHARLGRAYTFDCCPRRMLVGSLTNTYKFKADKTFSFTIGGVAEMLTI